MQLWQLQDAKAQLSEVVRSAVSSGPQSITVRGQPTVVMISQDLFDELVNNKESLVDFMKKSPLKGVDIDLTRDQSKTRNVKL